jgi:phosphomevalonate kinase
VSTFDEVHRISQASPNKQEINTKLTLFQAIRGKMREMGTLSGVPIEPIEQTQLLDLCVSQPGVIGGGVPGGRSLVAYSKLH